jgi:pre-60S factor REI1
MPTVTCNACNAGFDDEEQQRLHYRSEWHRYNLKRKVTSSPATADLLSLADVLGIRFIGSCGLPWGRE